MLKDDVLTTQWDQPAGGAKCFFDIANSGDIYDFLKESLVPTFYGEQADNGDSLSDELRYYYTNSKMLGMRIRQVRVKSGGCNIPEEYKSRLTRECWQEYASSHEEKEPWVGAYSKHEYKWSSSEKTGESPYNGKLGNYPASGYVVDFPDNQKDALNMVATLRKDLFIHNPTRVVLIEFQLYNEPADLFMTARIIIEMPASGGYRPRALFKAVTVPKVVTSEEIALIVFESIMYLMVFFFLYLELLEIRELGCEYIKIWNIIDLTNITLFLLTLAIRVAFFVIFSNQNPLERPESYFSMSRMERLTLVQNIFVACNAFLLWLKIFKYMQRNKRIMFLVHTVAYAKTELLYFIFIYILFLTSFVHAGYLAFNSQSKDFRSLSISFYTVFASLAGGGSSPINTMYQDMIMSYDSSSVIEANRVYGYIYIMFFQTLVLVILTNLFLAILNKAYIDVREELKSEAYVEKMRNKQPKIDVGGAIKASFRRGMTIFKKKDNKDQEAKRKAKEEAEKKRKKEEEEAAIKIQAAWRGNQARGQLANMKLAQLTNDKAVSERVRKLCDMMDQLERKLKTQRKKIKKKLDKNERRSRASTA